MSQFIVTLKLPKNRAHNPQNKRIGACPLSGHECTDQTGEHHSVIVDAQTSAGAHAYFTSQGIHVTRVEAVSVAAVLPGPVVTDEMVNAAATELRQVHGLAGLINNAAARVAIEAALRAGCTHPRMGAWWPCNFGRDEVRTCPDCDRIEKRKPEEVPHV